MTAFDPVAIDIETTGFTVDDEVTVIGFANEAGARVIIQTGDRDAAQLEATVRERVGTCSPVKVSTHSTEQALFDAMGTFIREQLASDDIMLVAYNGDRWRAGFDLPFLRTRLSRGNVPWPFEDLPYADLLPVITNRFNTTVTDSEQAQSDLVGVYDTLCDGPYGDLDPFADSAAAVTAFKDGDFAELALHNVADILRTYQLSRLAQRYCSKSDFRLKSLTPTTTTQS